MNFIVVLLLDPLAELELNWRWEEGGGVIYQHGVMLHNTGWHIHIHTGGGGGGGSTNVLALWKLL